VRNLGRWFGERIPEQSLVFTSAILLSTGVNTFTGIYTGGGPAPRRSALLWSAGLAVLAAALLLVAASQSGRVERAARAKSSDPSLQNLAREDLWIAMGIRYLIFVTTSVVLACVSLWKLT
jgi:hypothetical protein